MAQASGYLICYDIAEPRRLNRLHRMVSEDAFMVQYSVYLAWKTPQAMDELKEAIRGRINPHADDVRIYTLPERLDVVVLKRRDEDIWLLGCRSAQALLQLACIADHSADAD